MNSLSAHPDARPPEAPDLARYQSELFSQHRFRTEQLSWLAAGSRLEMPASTPDTLVSAVSEVSEALADGARAVLAEIEAALGRISDGSFGRCVRCGDSLPDDRLQILPWAAECMACQHAHEALP